MKLQNIDTFHHFGLVGMKAMLRSRDSKSSYLLGFLLYLQGCIQRPRKKRLTMAGFIWQKMIFWIYALMPIKTLFPSSWGPSINYVVSKLASFDPPSFVVFIYKRCFLVNHLWGYPPPHLLIPHNLWTTSCWLICFVCKYQASRALIKNRANI